jgi:hypothetical protein
MFSQSTAWYVISLNKYAQFIVDVDDDDDDDDNNDDVTTDVQMMMTSQL